MVNNATWEEIFSQDTPYNMQLLITANNGTILTNTEIASESFSLTEMISDSAQLRFGGCNASQFRIRIRSSVTDLTDKTLVVRLFAFEDSDIRIVDDNGTAKAYNVRTEEYEALDNDDSFLFGTYTVKTDKPTPDKSYRDISAFDAMEKVINSDVAQWYNSLYDTYSYVTIKQMRELLLDHLGIAYEPFNGVNDGVALFKTITTTTISAKTILEALCELNACFGVITRDNKFKCKMLTPTSVKTYLRYKQGQVNYQDALANVITQVSIINDLNKASATIGVAGNTYTINDNPLLVGKGEQGLQDVATHLMSAMAGTAYRPFSVSTYGDACIEVGDFITIPTSDKTIEAYVLNREMTGTQAFRDKLEAKGSERNSNNITGSAAIVSQLYSNLDVVNEQNELQYYLFRSAVDFNIGDGDPKTKIATLRYVVTKETTINILHEFKVTTENSLNSDRTKAYVWYYHDGELINYQPVETWGLEDTHMLDLNYALTETEENMHTWEVYLSAVGGNISIESGDASITLHGQGLVTSESWDGVIDVSDEISLVGHGRATFGTLTDNISFTWYDVEDIECTDVISLVGHGNATFGTMTDSVDINLVTPIFTRITDDEDIRITDDDNPRITDGGM